MRPSLAFSVIASLTTDIEVNMHTLDINPWMRIGTWIQGLPPT